MMQLQVVATFVAVVTLCASPVDAMQRRHDDHSMAPTTITDCHLHGTTQFCISGSDEYEVHLPDSADPTIVPDLYDNCHTHGDEMFCEDADGNHVEVHLVGAETEDEHAHHHHEKECRHDHEEECHHDHPDDDEDEEMDCHYHAGVKHCVPKKGSKSEPVSCDREDMEYNIPIRIGYIFVILTTSAVGVFGPIFLHRSPPPKMHLIFTILKQLGSGVIISTAFVHLYTHANIIFTNKCLIAQIPYEGTTAAILMAGIFMSFAVDYLCHRFIRCSAANAAEAPGTIEQFSSHVRTEMVNIMVLEAGICFHSILIGLTLIVTGDDFLKTMLIVIVFHQVFEGIALGSRIAALGTTSSPLPTHSYSETGIAPSTTTEEKSHVSSTANHPITSNISMKKKCALASAFALITPIGMAIGIGIMNTWNGNDPSTLLAMGVLDALSAGILVWTGIVEMWSEDWMMPHGEMYNAGFGTTVLGFVALISGMIMMSFLGKWA